MPLILTFDVGFRNLAFCCARIPGDGDVDAAGAPARVVGWDVIDLGTDWKKMLYMAQFTRIAESLDCLLDGMDGTTAVSEAWHAASGGSARDGVRIYVEQQPSRNPTMKNIEAMLKCYFSMRAHYRGERVRVVSVSARSKLKHVPAGELKKTYAARKKTAIASVREMIAGDEALVATFDGHKKRDDLADAALYVSSVTGAVRFVSA